MDVFNLTNGLQLQPHLVSEITSLIKDKLTCNESDTTTRFEAIDEFIANTATHKAIKKLSNNHDSEIITAANQLFQKLIS